MWAADQHMDLIYFEYYQEKKEENGWKNWHFLQTDWAELMLFSLK